MDVNSLIGNFTNIVAKHYFDFEGRTRRRDFWYFYLVYLVIDIVLSIVDNVIGTGLLAGLFALALFLPSLGLNVRRLHDVERSGWWLLIAFTGIGILLLLYWDVTAGTAGANQYGADPKAGEGAGAAAKAA